MVNANLLRHAVTHLHPLAGRTSVLIPGLAILADYSNAAKAAVECSLDATIHAIPDAILVVIQDAGRAVVSFRKCSTAAADVVGQTTIAVDAQMP